MSDAVDKPAHLADEVLTLGEIATELEGKISKATLYRIAEDGLKPENDSPFYKVRRRWFTTRADMVAWIRRNPGGAAVRSTDPMPIATPRDSVDELISQVQELRAAA